MNNLFSIFDPQSWFSLPLMWVALITPMMILSKHFWAANFRWGKGWNTLKGFLLVELNAVSSPQANPGKSLFLVSLFLFIACSNVLGLFPLVFTPTSHLVVTLSLSLPLWVGYFAYTCATDLSKNLAHLVPLGSPLGLSPFMVLIELVGNFIRPITLSVRLAANMVAGHLLLSLVSSGAVNCSLTLLGGIAVATAMLLMLEIGVALIQAYVFTLLSCRYLEEVESPFN